MSTTHLLYLHGFRSSPQSAKARLLGRLAHERAPDLVWWCPQLPPSPRESMDMLLAGVAAWPREHMVVVGSSLGGFYATCVAETLACRATVLNPAVDPARDLAAHIGVHTAWHDPATRFHFEARFVEELRALHPGPLRDPARYHAVIAKGDELLDWREMHARYAGANIRLLEGSDHALSDFEPHAHWLLDMLDIGPQG